MKHTSHTDYRLTTEAAFLLSMDVLKFYYGTVQKRMEDYHRQAGETTERAYKVIAIYVTLLTLLCAYVFTYNNPSWHQLPVWILLTGTATSTFWMLKVIMPRSYMPLGRTVSELQPNEYAQSFTDNEESVDDDIQMRCILRDEINQLEYAIRWQEEVNNRRTSMFANSLKTILVGIVLALLSFPCVMFFA